MSELITLEELFQEHGEDRFFQVPDYQRSYSWENEHREDLLEDISDLLLHDATHFTGTVVAARPDEPDGTYQIVDGQQRLTTLVLLLGRLALRLEALGDSEGVGGIDLEEVRDRFIRSRQRVGATRPRLELNTDTTALFRELCLKSEIPNEHIPPRNKAETNLLQAAHQVDRYLKAYDRERLEALHHAVTRRMGFLFYAPRNGTEIGLMFEVINSRGKPLSELDKVKNFLIYYANRHGMPDLHEQVNKAWAGILTDLNAVGMTTNDEEQMFLQSCWVPFGDPRARKSGPVYEGLKAQVAQESREGGYRRLSAFVRLLRHGAQTFRALYSRKAVSEKTAESIWRERVSFHPRLASVLPLLVALYYRESNGERRAVTLELIEKLNFRYYVLGIASRSDSRQSELFQLAYDYFHGDPNVPGGEFTTESLQERLRAFVRENADRRRMIKNLVLEADESWDFYEWPGLKFFLASYEQSLCESKRHSKPLPELLSRRDPDTYNDFYHREHIVAQNDQEDIDAESADYIKRRLGNFVLMREGTNKAASDGRAVDKIQDTYEATGMNRLYQVQELQEFLDRAEAYVWNERGWKVEAKGCRDQRLRYLMDRREEHLVAFALERWHVPGADPEELPTVRVDSVFTDGAVWQRA
ncbi:DUF262 domain-containing protein [Arhodomonas sp. SL1]|uniref:DUF262 domain-containing protein n=1 Tax=Arhodomonas sp. SL1 TaxID=3425691 RepID=UPI003F88540C